MKANSVKALLEMSTEKKLTLKEFSKVRILAKTCDLINQNKKKDERNKAVRSEEFQSLLGDLRLTFEYQSDSTILTILNSLLRIKYRDEAILSSTCKLVINNKIRRPQSITNILYVLAKFKYNQSVSAESNIERTQLLAKSAEVFKKELVLPTQMVCRNLWNFYALMHFDKELFDKFAQIIAKSSDSLNELDVANALRSFAQFKYMNFDALEGLIKTTIQNASTYNIKSLAVISNSLAILEIQNTTVFKIIKNVILKDFLEGKTTNQVETLEPIDCAQLMTAYCRVKIFDLDLLQTLEEVFLQKIEKAEGETLVTMFNSHANWAQNMIEECLIKKTQKRAAYNAFKKYNEEFYNKIAVNLARNIEEINLKGVILVLAHGNMAHLKKRENIRIMRSFAVKGINNIKSE